MHAYVLTNMHECMYACTVNINLVCYGHVQSCIKFTYTDKKLTGHILNQGIPTSGVKCIIPLCAQPCTLYALLCLYQHFIVKAAYAILATQTLCPWTAVQWSALWSAADGMTLLPGDIPECANHIIDIPFTVRHSLCFVHCLTLYVFVVKTLTVGERLENESLLQLFLKKKKKLALRQPLV